MCSLSSFCRVFLFFFLLFFVFCSYFTTEQKNFFEVFALACVLSLKTLLVCISLCVTLTRVKRKIMSATTFCNNAFTATSLSSRFTNGRLF